MEGLGRIWKGSGRIEDEFCIDFSKILKVWGFWTDLGGL